MPFGIMRVEKRKIGAVGGLQAEADRKTEINLPRSDVDWNRTKDNYAIVRTDKSWYQAINDVLADHGIEKKPRKDAVVMIDGLYTATPDAMKQMTPEERDQYFRECVAFHEKHYGKVFSAIVHLDEATPHLHVASVPVIERADGSYSLSAKDLMGTPVDYRKRQDAFHAEVSEKYGLERGVLSDPADKRERMDTLEYKIHKDEEKLNSLDMNIELKKTEIEHLTTLRDRISSFLHRIYSIVDVIRDKLESFMEKVETGITITEKDLSESWCEMETIKPVNTDAEQFYTPEFFGRKFIWEEFAAPAYKNDADGYNLVGIYEIDTKEYTERTDYIETYSRPSAEYMVNDLIDEIECERIEIDREIKKIEDTDISDRDSIDY